MPSATELTETEKGNLVILKRIHALETLVGLIAQKTHVMSLSEIEKWHDAIRNSGLTGDPAGVAAEIVGHKNQQNSG